MYMYTRKQINQLVNGILIQSNFPVCSDPDRCKCER